MPRCGGIAGGGTIATSRSRGAACGGLRCRVEREGLDNSLLEGLLIVGGSTLVAVGVWWRDGGSGPRRCAQPASPDTFSRSSARCTRCCSVWSSSTCRPSTTRRVRWPCWKRTPAQPLPAPRPRIGPLPQRASRRSPTTSSKPSTRLGGDCPEASRRKEQRRVPEALAGDRGLRPARRARGGRLRRDAHDDAAASDAALRKVTGRTGCRRCCGDPRRRRIGDDRVHLLLRRHERRTHVAMIAFMAFFLSLNVFLIALYNNPYRADLGVKAAGFNFDPDLPRVSGRGASATATSTSTSLRAATTSHAPSGPAPGRRPPRTTHRSWRRRSPTSRRARPGPSTRTATTSSPATPRAASGPRCRARRASGVAARRGLDLIRTESPLRCCVITVVRTSPRW